MDTVSSESDNDSNRELEQFEFEYVRLNIGGKIFLTEKSTLQRIPNTVLSELSLSHPRYDAKNDWYFFDRNSVYFESILDCYRNGKFHITFEGCLDPIFDELAFWKIPRSLVLPCCRRKIVDYCVDREAYSTLFSEFKVDFEKLRKLADSSLAYKIWINMQYPVYSRFSKIFCLINTTLVIGSLLVLSLTYEPAYEPKANKLANRTSGIDDNSHAVYTVNVVINFVIIVIALIKFLLAPSKLKFCRSFLNITEFIANIAIIIVLVGAEFYIYDNATRNAWFGYVVPLLLLRVFSIFRLGPLFRPIKVLGLVLKTNLTQLFFLGIMFLILSYLLGFSMLVGESDNANDSKISNIQTAAWVAIVTMTTLGYGDFYPIHTGGRVVAAASSLIGILFAGLLIPIVASTFSLCYKISSAQEDGDKFCGDSNTGEAKRCKSHIQEPPYDTVPTICMVEKRQDSNSNYNAAFGIDDCSVTHF